MAEKLGVENLSKVVTCLGQVGTGAANKGGIFSFLAPVLGLAGVNWAQVGEEVKDLSADERLKLEGVLSAEFKPNDPILDAGLDKFLALGEKTAAIIEKGVKDGIEIYDTVKELVVEWKTVLGVK